MQFERREHMDNMAKNCPYWINLEPVFEPTGFPKLETSEGCNCGSCKCGCSVVEETPGPVFAVALAADLAIAAGGKAIVSAF